MDTKIPDHWKDLKLELEPETYKTYKALINDYDEHYNKSKKKNTKNTVKYKPEPHPRPVSILKNNLGDVSWAHDLEHIFKFFDNYHKKIHSFKKIFPNLIYDLNFENFVQYPELESKKLKSKSQTIIITPYQKL